MFTFILSEILFFFLVVSSIANAAIDWIPLFSWLLDCLLSLDNSTLR